MTGPSAVAGAYRHWAGQKKPYLLEEKTNRHSTIAIPAPARIKSGVPASGFSCEDD